LRVCVNCLYFSLFLLSAANVPTGELQKPAEESQIHCAHLSQPLSTAIQIALVNAYARCGIYPAAVIGHSSGEIAAAYAGGSLSMSDAIIIAYYRGFITTTQELKGGMAAIGLGKAEVSEFLVDGISIACENSPRSVTISGDAVVVRDVIAAIRTKQPDILARALKVDMAYHSSK
jgi:acyl transferase domain-containing protein